MKINMSSGPEYRFLMGVLDCENAYEKINALDHSSSNPYEHDVVLTIDGVEFDIRDFIRRYEELFDQAVKYEASKMDLTEFDSRFEEITRTLEDFSDELRRIRRKKFPEIRFPDDPDYLYDD